MRVNVVLTSDFTCPWCFIGHVQLTEAIGRMPPDIAVDVDHHPFELNPGLPPEGMDRTTLRTAKFGVDRARMLDARIMAASAGTGAVFNHARMTRVPNTTLAHRLMWVADPAIRMTLAGRFYTGYFTEGQDLSQPQTLRGLAGEAGLATDGIEAVLSRGAGAAEVQAAQHRAAATVGGGIPQLEIGRMVTSGAQPADVVERALLRAAGRS